MLLLTRSDVRRLLRMPDCIEAVEDAFRQHAAGNVIPPAILGVHVDGGGFHVKTAGMRSDTGSVFAAKVNANFPGNTNTYGLPTIQGIIALFDAANGRVLALLDSIEITSVRTAAASAVAAKYLARTESERVTICGCGEQGRSHLRALRCVRPIRRVFAFDRDPARARQFAVEMSGELEIDVTAVAQLGAGTSASDIWVTCTTSREWFLGRDHIRPGAFIAAVGADNPEKQEIEPALMAHSVVIADLLDQAATIGDLRGAIAASAMRREDVRAELADVLAGTRPGRKSGDEIIVFDSTGTALQDVAAAHLVYNRAIADRAGTAIDLGAVEVHS
jgi:ornithine cyclodeaminase/alanine dehydrogenase-like protein (mu-crystallin family)